MNPPMRMLVLIGKIVKTKGGQNEIWRWPSLDNYRLRKYAEGMNLKPKAAKERLRVVVNELTREAGPYEVIGSPDKPKRLRLRRSKSESSKPQNKKEAASK